MDAAERLEEYSLDKLNQAIAQNPEEPRLYHERGVRLAETGADAKALADFQRALEMQPNAERYYRCGLILSRQGQFYEALEQLNGALERDPDHDAAKAERAMVYANIERYDLAMRDLAVLINDRPANYIAWANRAAIHARRGFWPEVVGDATRAIKLNPDYAPAYKVRAIGHQVLGHIDKAIGDFETFLRLGPSAAERAEVEAALQRLEQRRDQPGVRGWLDRLLKRGDS
jgi:tetratricopeptide (TPR) repeat protein